MSFSFKCFIFIYYKEKQEDLSNPENEATGRMTNFLFSCDQFSSFSFNLVGKNQNVLQQFALIPLWSEILIFGWFQGLCACLWCPQRAGKRLLLLASVDKSILAAFLPHTQVSSFVMSLSRNVWKLWGSEGELLPLGRAGQILPSLCSAGAAHTAHLGFSPLLCILPPL